MRILAVFCWRYRVYHVYVVDEMTWLSLHPQVSVLMDTSTSIKHFPQTHLAKRLGLPMIFHSRTPMRKHENRSGPHLTGHSSYLHLKRDHPRDSGFFL